MMRQGGETQLGGRKKSRHEDLTSKRMAVPEVRGSQRVCEGAELGRRQGRVCEALSPPFPTHLKSDSDVEELDTGAYQFPRYPPPQAAGGRECW